MIKFPSIESFRGCVANVRRAADFKGQEYPTIRFSGSVKLHGTNGSIRLNEDGSLTAFSREKQLSVGDDNYGFAAYVAHLTDEDKDNLLFDCKVGDTLFGEWCGQGIQKNVAISQIGKRIFVPFKIHHAATDTFVNYIASYRFGIPLVLSYNITIDFKQPDLALPELNRLVDEVETCCPYTKLVHGIEGIGEGIVWTPLPKDIPEWLYPDEPYRVWFKTKGEKHGNKSVKTSAPISATPEQSASLEELAAMILPDWRLEQGIAAVGLDIKQTGNFIKWVVADILKEEKDRIDACVAVSGIKESLVTADITKRSKIYFMDKIKTSA